jgi:hypothetical protein
MGHTKAGIAGMNTASANRAAGRRGGFTLVELVVAMALVIVFGAMAAATLRYGTNLWRSGHRRSFAYDTATAVFHQLDNDIGAAKSQFWNKDSEAYDPRVFFIVDWDDDGRQRLRFVRGIPDDAVNPRIRQAGDGDDNDNDTLIDEEHYDLLDLADTDGEGVLDAPDGGVDEDLAPLEGICEVAYLMGTNVGDSDTLHRAVLAPIGGPNSLFDDDNIGDPSTVGLALAENVILHFELRLWSQHTTTWDDGAPFAPWEDSYNPEYCGPALEWDSDNHEADDPADNIYPRSVMAVLVVDPPGRLQEQNPIRLTEAITSDALTIPVRGRQPVYNPAWPYIRINDEWIRFESFDVETQEFIIASEDDRGVRGTEPEIHLTGDRVRFGYTFTRAFHNPTGKDYWGMPED